MARTPLGLKELAAAGYIAEDWAHALAPQADTLARLGEFLREEHEAGVHTLPAGDNILRAFQLPLDRVRVLIVGQDPYPTPGHPIGLSFAVDRHVRPLPRSLSNIYRELEADLGIPPASHGDLTAWTSQGVMLLNRVLTVRAGAPASHAKQGWEAFTEHAIRVLASRGGPLVAVLWGNQARALVPLLGNVPIVESAHPSPLSASRGFFGSKPFSRVNEALVRQGGSAIDWRIPDDVPAASVTTS